MLRTNLTHKKPKNTQQINQEAFYTKKRALVRKAEQVSKACNSDVFIVLHQKDTDKIFSYSSQPGFQLEKISSLVLKDVKEAAFLKRVQKFENTDFDIVQQNISQAQQIVREHNVDYQKQQNCEFVNDNQNGENGQVNGYNSTADSSKYLFSKQETPPNQPKTGQNMSQQVMTQIEQSNQGSQSKYENTPINYGSVPYRINCNQTLQPNQLYNPENELLSPTEVCDYRENIKEIDFCTNGTPQMKGMKNRFKETRQEYKKRDIVSIAIETLPGSKSYVASMTSIKDLEILKNQYEQNINYAQSAALNNTGNHKQQDYSHSNMYNANNYSKQVENEYSDMNRTQNQYRGTLFDRTIDDHDNYDNHDKFIKNEDTLSIIQEECQYQYNVNNRIRCKSFGSNF